MNDTEFMALKTDNEMIKALEGAAVHINMGNMEKGEMHLMIESNLKGHKLAFLLFMIAEMVVKNKVEVRAAQGGMAHARAQN